jgi:hypothetical protein
VKGVSGRRRYQFRLLERRLGTSKYAAFVTLSVALAWPLRTYLLRQHIATAIAPGPYPIIFAAFPLLLREVPACATFKLGSQACVTMRWDGCLTERARLQTICRLSWSRCELRSVRAAWWRRPNRYSISLSECAAKPSLYGLVLAGPPAVTSAGG